MALRNHARMLSAAAIALIAAIAVAGWSLAGVSAEDQDEPQAAHSKTTITVSGTAGRSLTADQTTIEFTISTLSQRAQAASQEGGRTQQAIEARLRQMAIGDDQLHTRNVSLHEEYDWTEGGRVSLGFRYRHSLHLQVEGTDDAGRVIDAIVGAAGGAVSIDSVSFSSSERAAVEREMLLAAMRDARATADAMAAELDKTIVDTVEISVVSSLSPITAEVEEYAADRASAGSLTVVRGGQDEVQVSVIATFVAR